MAQRDTPQRFATWIAMAFVFLSGCSSTQTNPVGKSLDGGADARRAADASRVDGHAALQEECFGVGYSCSDGVVSEEFVGIVKAGQPCAYVVYRCKAGCGPADRVDVVGHPESLCNEYGRDGGTDAAR